MEYTEYLSYKSSLASAAGLARAKEIVRRDGADKFIADLGSNPSGENRQ
jgi:hypothetical protein